MIVIKFLKIIQIFIQFKLFNNRLSQEAKHPTHFNFEESMKIINILKPKKAILTNLHNDLDYKKLKSKLPSNIIPAYDGLKFNF